MTVRRHVVVTMTFIIMLSAAPVGAQDRSSPAADELRSVAEQILTERSYAQSQPGVLERLFDWIAGLFDFNPPSPDLVGPEVGGSGLALLRTALIVMAILLLVAWGTTFVSRQRSALRITGHDAVREGREASVAELERRAAEAAKRGAYGESLRLRFEAGLVRLERKGTLSHHTTQSSSEVSDTLRLDEFDQVARTFDAVVYGGRNAEAGDDAFSASTWPTIVSRAPKPDSQEPR